MDQLDVASGHRGELLEILAIGTPLGHDLLSDLAELVLVVGDGGSEEG